MADFQIVRCRVANFPTGLLLRNSQSSNFYQITLANNTFYNLGETGLKFDAIHPLSAETTGKTQFMLNANYFAKTMALLVVPAGVAAIPEWAPVNNGRDAVTPANLLLPTVVGEASFLGTSVNDPATFLVPDPKSKLVTSGPNGSTIGYTPAP